MQNSTGDKQMRWLMLQ